MRKLIPVLILIMIAIYVSACNSEDSSGDLEKTELTVWVAGNSAQIQETYNSMVDAFNEEYESQGISAKAQYEPWGELDQKLTTALAGGVGPDVFMHGSAAAAGFADEGQIEPLDKYFDEWDDFSDFNEGYLSAGIVGDENYVLPVQGSGRLMFYREDIFEEAGVEVPETLDELLEISHKFVDKDGTRFTRAATSLPVEGIDLQQVWSPFLWSNGGTILNDDATEATINSPAAIEAIEFYKSFFDEDLTPISGMEGQGDQHPLGTGEIAFGFEGAHIIEQIKNYTPDAYDHLRVVAPPAGLENVTGLVAATGFYMNANTDYKDEAWKLLSFIGNAENIEKGSAELNFLPVRNSLVDADFVKEDRLLSEYVQVDSETEGRASPNIPRWTTIRDLVADNIELAIYGELDPEEALKKAEEEINEELQR